MNKSFVLFHAERLCHLARRRLA